MNKRQLSTGIAVVVALSVIAIFFFVSNPFEAGNDLAFSAGQDPADVAQLIVQDEIVGNGAEARVGDVLLVNYTGKLDDGTVFDTSVGQTPYPFVLGAGEVIPGWDQGLKGMKVGGKRLLIIPAALGYGSQGYGPIPPNATLIFEVELVGITSQGQ